jgi:hypothetical protein
MSYICSYSVQDWIDLAYINSPRKKVEPQHKTIRHIDEWIDQAGLNLPENKELSYYERQALKKENRLIDRWISVENKNKFGDPLNTKYKKTSPLFHRRFDRYDYIREQFPKKPWMKLKRDKQISEEKKLLQNRYKR